MKPKALNFPAIAAILYALFAAIGIAVWFILVHAAAPSTSTAASVWATSLQMLQTGTGSTINQLHATLTLLAAAFAILLLVKSVMTLRRYLVASAVAIVYAGSVWLTFDFKTALLPIASAVVISIAWFRAIRSPRPVSAS